MWEAQGGLGYSIFAIAMTAGRLGGDFVTARVGDRVGGFIGATIMTFLLSSNVGPFMAGFALLLAAPIRAVAIRPAAFRCTQS
jgi:hypothetical protein